MDRGNYETKPVFDHESAKRIPLPCFVADDSRKLVAVNELLASTWKEQDNSARSEQLFAEYLLGEKKSLMNIGKEAYHLKRNKEYGEDMIALYPTTFKQSYKDLEDERQSHETQKEGILAAIPDLIYLIIKDGISFDCRAH